MEKNNQHIMELNREIAMRLWNKSFGKAPKATDFAGRTISKGAYNDRNSDFGWNVDHIQPQSRGGTTADHNLVCCHILTNDEKADKFPCFKANGHSFEIIKVQNHYEIRGRSSATKTAKPEDTGVDFYDSADGLRLFKKLKGFQNQKRLIGTVWVKLEGLTNNAVAEFIEELFDTENISYAQDSGLDHRMSWTSLMNREGEAPTPYNLVLTIRNFDVPLKKDSEALLDKCILLNTYMSRYFKACRYVRGYAIYYREDCVSRAAVNAIPKEPCIYPTGSASNTLFVSNSVLENTRAGNAGCRIYSNGYAEYNYIFNNLADNLTKEANRG